MALGYSGTEVPELLARRVKRMTDSLVADCGGWVPLAMRAWKKYTRRKLLKRRDGCLPEPAVAAAAPVVAEAPRVAWTDGCHYDDVGDDDDCGDPEAFSEGRLYDDDANVLSSKQSYI